MRRAVPMEIKHLVRNIVLEELLVNDGEVDPNKVNEKLWELRRKKFVSNSLFREVIEEALDDIGYIDAEPNQAD